MTDPWEPPGAHDPISRFFDFHAVFSNIIGWRILFGSWRRPCVFNPRSANATVSFGFPHEGVKEHEGTRAMF